jgi:hypothetical protein
MPREARLKLLNYVGPPIHADIGLVRAKQSDHVCAAASEVKHVSEQMRPGNFQSPLNQLRRQ